MKYILALSALLAVALADASAYEASYYPSAPAKIDTDPDLRVVNGHDAQRGQFLYQISIQRRESENYRHFCGGSIIGQLWILTAAHCVSEISADILQVKAGILLQTDTNVTDEQTRSIAQIIIHELYPGGDQVSPNDVALLRLSQNLNYGPNVQPIAIPLNNYQTQGDTVLSGWGVTGTGSSPNNLQYVEVPIVESDECQRILDSYIKSNNPFQKELNVCTGIRDGGEAICDGDSGGPLVQEGKVIGIVSWALSPCGYQNTPSVYGRVSAYDSWIELNTNGEVKAE